MAKCRMATLSLPTLSHSERAQLCATAKLVVVAQHLMVRRGCEVVAHTQAGARRLHDVRLALFLLVVEPMMYSVV
jgi:hypothetical protein